MKRFNLIIGLLLLMALPAWGATEVDLSVSAYTWSPDPVVRGGASVFSVTVTNNDAGTAAGAVTLALQLPANIDFSTAATTTPAGCSFNLAASPQTLTCTSAGLAPLNTWNLTFTGVGLMAGTQNTTAAVTAADNTDPNPLNDTLTKPTTVINGADLTILKTGPASATAGSTISFTLRATNNGPDPASSFRITDNLPATIDFTYQSATGTGWNCGQSGTTVTCDYSGSSVVAGGSAPDITLTGILVSSAGTITNGASVASTDGNTGDPVSGNNGPSQVVVTVVPGTDLRANKNMVSVATGMTSYATGEAVNLTLSATNLGPQNATGVTVTDTVPADFTIGTLPSGCSRTGQAITCTVGALNSGVTSSGFLIPLTVNGGTAGNSGSNIANVARTTPTGGSNTPASVNYTISNPFAHLTITKSKGPNPVAAGGTITNTVTVTNSGTSTSAATGTIRVTDALSANETYVSFAGSGWSCGGVVVGTSGTLTCDYAGANLARGASLPALTITTQATGGFLGSITNTACTGLSAGSPHLPADNSSTGNCQSQTITGTPRNVDLSITKVASIAAPTHVLTSDGTVAYILTVANAGPDVAPTVTVNDSLQAWYSGDAGTTGGSAVLAGAVAGESCSFGPTVTCTLLNVVSGTPRTITITLNRPFKDGAITNTATVSTPDAIDTNGGNNSAMANIIVDPVADVAVTLVTGAPNPDRVGVQLTYTTSIKNNGPSTAAGVVLRQVIDPLRMSYVTGSASLTSGGSCSYQSTFGAGAYTGQAGIECSGVTLTNGQSGQLTYRVIPRYPYPDPLPATYTSSASITTTAVESDAPLYGNNASSGSVTVTLQTLDLAVSDNDPGYDPTAFGDFIIYQVKAQNNGPSQATGFKLTVTPIPPPQGSALNPYSMTYNAGGSTLPGGATCSPVGADIICYLGADQANSVMAPNTSQTFSLRFDTGPLANVPRGSLTYQTTANVSSFETLSGFDTLTGNNTVTETTTVLPKTDLILVSKSVSKPIVDLNEPFTYTVMVGNRGPSEVSSLRMTDVLPAGFVMTGAPTVTPGAGVTLAPGTNSCTAPAVGSNGTITCTLGPIPVDGTGADATRQVTITIPVRAAYQAGGSYSFAFNTNITNTATVAVIPGISIDPDLSNNSGSAIVQVRKNSIAGYVFTDTAVNNPPVLNANRIANVRFDLSGTDAYAGQAITIANVLSDATGLFRFDNLPPGTYEITETQPTGYSDALEAVGSLSSSPTGSAVGTAPATTCDGIVNCSGAAGSNRITGITFPKDYGIDATNYLFQEIQNATISGYVYHDANNDGDRSGAGEIGTNGINGVQIHLAGTDYRGIAYTGNATTATIVAGTTGEYRFTDVPPGTGYILTETSQPAGYLEGRDQNGAGLANVIAGSYATDVITVGTAAAGTTYGNRNFGELLPATISGYVYIDSNANAVHDAGETSGLTNVTVTLTGTDDLGTPINTSTTTSGSGSYSFSGLRPGTYTVTETQPGGVTHTGAYAGSNGGTIAGVARTANTAVTGAGNLSISAIAINSSNTAANYNFGESGQGLSGYVYIDSNGNGQRDAGEPGITGVSITLSGNTSSGTNVCSAISPNPCTITTGAGGAYSFAGLPASDATGYTLTEQLQTAAPLNNFGDGGESLGTIGGVARGSTGSDTFTNIVLAVGETGINYNFGELGSRLSGTVYHDRNNNAALDGLETGIAGVTLTISGTTLSGVNINTMIGGVTTTTDAAGNFSFNDLPASNGSGYTITETQPSNYLDGSETAGTLGGTVNNGSFGTTAAQNRISAIHVGANVTGTGYLFGERLGSLAGLVYFDANNDGNMSGAGETGLSGVTVTLAGNAASGVGVCTLIAASYPACATMTDASGAYIFNDLPAAGAGGYTLTVTQPPGYSDGLKKVGTSSGTAGAPGTRTISAIPFGAGANATGYLFGEILGSLSGRVFLDTNLDGTFNGADSGLSGINVTLSGYTFGNNGIDDGGSGDDAAITAVTVASDSSGTYSFSNLAPGKYSVTEPSQPAGTANGITSAGSQGGSASGIGVTPSAISAITISGQNATGYNFAEVTPPSVSKSFSPGASHSGGLSQLSITLGNSNSAAITLSSIFTDTLPVIPGAMTIASPNGLGGTCTLGSVTAVPGSGSISYASGASIPAGGCTIIVTVTASAVGSYTNSIPAGALQTSAGTNPSPASASLSIAALGSLSGRVFLDRNLDGLYNGADSGLSGINVTLSGYTFGNNGIDDGGSGDDAAITAVTVASDSSGTYSFSNLAPGKYSVTEPSQPAGTANGITSAGSQGGSASGIGVTPSAISAITISGQNATGYNFAEVTPPSVSKSFSPGASHSGGLSQLSITLGNSNSAAITLSSIFTDTLPVIPGAMTIASPNGLGGTCTLGSVTAVPGSGSISYASGASIPAGGCTIIVTVTASAVGSYTNSIPAGALQTSAGTNPSPASASLSIAALGSLSGRVFLDRNLDGLYNGADSGLSGINVTLSGYTFGLNGIDDGGSGDDAAITAVTVASDSSGTYSFSNLAPGKYTVTEPSQPAGTANGITSAGSQGGSASGIGVTPSAISAITISGQNATGYNFAEVTPPSVTKSFSPGASHSGGLSQLSITLGNSNSAAITLSSIFTDTLPVIPGAMTIASPNGLGGTCTLGSVTAVPGSGSISYASGASIPAGGCTIIVTVTASAVGSYTNSIPAGALQTSAGTNPSPASASLVVSPLGSISGTVFLDRNSDGIFNGSDNGLSGVSVTLSGYTFGLNGIDDGGSGDDAAITAVTVASDSSGTYSFTSLAPGKYTITEPAQPPGTFNGITSAGSQGGSASGIGATPSSIGGVTINSQNATGYNFAEVVAIGSLSGRVFLDTNLDGTFNGADSGLSGINVTLSGYTFGNNGIDDGGSGDDAAITAVTVASDSSGTYSFSNLAPGKYSVTEPSQPAGTANGITSAGSQGGSASGIGVTPSAISAITISGQNATGYNFAEVTPPSVSKSFSPGASHSGGLSQLSITLGNSNSAAITLSSIFTDTLPVIPGAMTIASPNGLGGTCTLGSVTAVPGSGSISYASGASIPAGGCTIIVTVTASAVGSYTNSIPAGALQTSAGTNPSPASASLSIAALGSLSGRVFLDRNLDGLYNGADSGLSGINVTLSGYTFGLNGIDDGGSGDDAAITAVTVASDSSGTYSFSNLAPGKYTVTEPSQPAGTANGITSAGSQGGSASGIGVTPSAISAITISGQNATGYNFAEVTPPSVTKSFSPGASHSGGLSQLSITLGNSNSAAITLSSIFTDTLPVIPGAMTIASPNGLGGTCTLGSVTAVPGSGSISYASGASIPAGGCTIIVTVTASAVGSYTNSIPAGALQTSAGTNPSPASASLSIAALGSLSGRVFLDRNLDGLYNGADSGLSGINVTLSGYTFGLNGIDDGGSGDDAAITAVTVASDSSGTYSFSNLAPGKYTVTEPSQPAGTANGITSAGSQGGSASGIGVTPSAISAITISGQNATGYNFAEVIAYGSISGKVYEDKNNDGVINGTDTGIAGVSLVLSGYTYGVNGVDNGGGGDDSIITPVTVVTSASGDYSFTNVAPGRYTITEPVQPPNTLNGSTTAGSLGGVPTTVAATPSAISSVSLSGQSATGYNFGEVAPGRISGTVYIDSNQNGIRDAGEPGIGNVTIALTGQDDQGTPVNVTTITADDGSYLVTGLRPSAAGGYTLTETQPPGFGDYPGGSGTTVGTIAGTVVGAAAQNTVNGIVVHSGDAGIGYDFRETTSGLSGSVYLDGNRNGGFDSGEAGIGGVTIALSGNDVTGAAVTRTTLTAADGTFQFSGLRGGTYTLTETQPVIYEDGRETAGSAGGNVDNSSFSSAAAQNSISAVSLPAGAMAGGYLFGEFPGLAAKVSGTVWYNSSVRDQTQQPGEPGLAGWIVEAVLGGVVRGTATTGQDGGYEIPNLPAGYGYEIRFRHPLNHSLYGDPVSQDPGYIDTTPDLSRHTIANLTLRSGGNVVMQNLPINPSGVVYNSVTRVPMAGVTVNIAGPPGFDPAAHLVGGSTNVSQLTDSSGFYQFLLLPGAPSGTYSISLVSPPGYTPGASAMIPATAGPFNPGAGPGNVAVQTQATAPVASQATTYYLSLSLSGSSAAVINNHLPVDPILGGAIRISKTTPLVNVSKGELVPYTIEATNTLSAAIPNIDLMDQVPPGFKYRTGSATINGVKVDPVVSGRMLRWPNLTFTASEKKTLKLILVIGSGVGEGEYTNQAWALNNIVNTQVSNVGEATVRIIPDPTFDCTDIIGKVFDDKNANGYQDEGESGIANVRLATARGWLITTDAEGRFHVACAAIPQADRGSNFIMKLDERTLPSGYRVTTENPRIIRATRGKMVKLNFGATIHRVVRVEVNDAAFTGEGDELKPEWSSRFDELPEQLRERPSVVRLAYRVEHGPPDRARQRLETLAATLRKRWESLKGCYPLSIEQELMEVTR